MHHEEVDKLTEANVKALDDQKHLDNETITKADVKTLRTTGGVTKAETKTMRTSGALTIDARTTLS